MIFSHPLIIRFTRIIRLSSHMKFLNTLNALSLPRQLALGAAVLGTVLVMVAMIRGVMQEPMGLLYSGLEMERAGEIVEALEKRGIAYELEGTAIFVPSQARDQIRISLAQEGLPRQAVQGYELLDNVNGFSTTSEMYNASYWRAKEGELTRTILAVPGVEGARVHVGASLRSGFSRSRRKQTASVTLTASRDLSAAQAEGIQYMVALAISGLAPEDVAVIDSRRGIVAGPNVDKMANPGLVADGISARLEANVQRLLEARLGAGNSEVSISVDVTRALERTSAVRFDPDSRVVRQRTTNDTNQSGTTDGGVLTVASNLPQGVGANGGGTNTARNSTESISYEVNETRTEVERLPGEVKRISVAVMLNETAIVTAGATVTAAELLAEFEGLIASAVGLDLARGDTISVEAMPFNVAEIEEPIAAPTFVKTMLDRYMWSGLQALLLSVVVLVLGFGVIRPILRPKANESEADALNDLSNVEALPGSGAESDPFAYLKDYAREREAETTALLQEWLAEDTKVAVNDR